MLTDWHSHTQGAKMAETPDPTKRTPDNAPRPATDNAARGMADNGARNAQAAVDTAVRNTKGIMGETEQLARHGADRARDIQNTAAQQTADSAEAAADMSSKVVDHGRDLMLMGARTAADVSGRIADMGYGRGHHLLASSVQVMDVYRDATERSADRLQAMFASYLTLGRSVQQMQHAWLEMVDQKLEHANHKPQDLLRCSNVVEFAEVQRDLYLDAISHAFDSSSRLFEMAGRALQDAVRPMRNLGH
jgi:hypothetical protein